MRFYIICLFCVNFLFDIGFSLKCYNNDGDKEILKECEEGHDTCLIAVQLEDKEVLTKGCFSTKEKAKSVTLLGMVLNSCVENKEIVETNDKKVLFKYACMCNSDGCNKDKETSDILKNG